MKLVESIDPDPIRFPVKPGAKLTPGQVVSIVQYEGDLVIDICKGYNALGLLGNRCIGGNNIDFSIRKLAKVYPQRMIANIKNFDRGNELQPGYSLYCNSEGILSSKKPFEDSLVLAKVISPVTEKRKSMQILWL